MNITHLRLSSISEDSDSETARYRATHTTPGREGTTLDFTVTVRAFNGLTTADIDFGSVPKGDTTEDALSTLGDWLQRAADAINQRQRDTYPQFPNYK